VIGRPELAGGAGSGSFGPNSSPRRFRGMPQLDLTDNERAVLIATLRRLIDLEPEPSAQTLKLILDRLEPQKPQALPEDASTG
jgi:hypothetical protein